MTHLNRLLLVGLLLPFTTGCQLPYLLTSAYNQMKLLTKREPLTTALERKDLTDGELKKLRLAESVRTFAESKLQLNVKKNYSSFVKLEKPYVTWVVNASPKFELKHHLWSFPIVGDLPYKGFWDEESAKKEEEKLQSEHLDTYVRGVSAFSTLGWFSDPILSSMLNYKDHDLVNTIIHESTHATLFIKSNADFNERLASFVGDVGTEQFYLERDGKESPTLRQIREENEDALIFSSFISRELKNLAEIYKKMSPSEQEQEDRTSLFQDINAKFSTEIKPKLKTKAYLYFEKVKLNNAKLLLYKTYSEDISDFKKAFQKCDSEIPKFLEKMRALESSRDPAKDLKAIFGT